MKGIWDQKIVFVFLFPPVSVGITLSYLLGTYIMEDIVKTVVKRDQKSQVL